MKKALLMCFTLLAINLVLAGTIRPKYGPQAIPLSVSHEFFRKNPADSFWSLMPYYLSQQNGGSCSVATVAMVVNAARAGQKLDAEDRLATEADLLKKVDQGAWKKSLWIHFRGVALDELKPLVEASFKAYGIAFSSIEVVHVADTSEEARARLHSVLVGLGKSKRTYVLANFLQGVYTGDAEVGHFAPVGAYDAENKKVLILDPDREYYEPYWISEEVFLKGMATLDSQSKKNRGYIVVHLPSNE